MGTRGAVPVRTTTTVARHIYHYWQTKIFGQGYVYQRHCCRARDDRSSEENKMYKIKKWNKKKWNKIHQCMQDVRNGDQSSFVKSIRSTPAGLSQSWKIVALRVIYLQHLRHFHNRSRICSSDRPGSLISSSWRRREKQHSDCESGEKEVMLAVVAAVIAVMGCRRVIRAVMKNHRRPRNVRAKGAIATCCPDRTTRW